MPLRRMTLDQLAAYQQRRKAQAADTLARAKAPETWAPQGKPSKYGNRAAYRDGWRFDSEREARCYDDLLLQQQAGHIKWILRQVPIHLAPKSSHKATGTTMRVDFLVCWTDGCMQFLDAKGCQTADWKTKAAMAEALLGVKIDLW